MDQESTSCAYCFTRNLPCDGNIPRCQSCSQYNLLCSTISTTLIPSSPLTPTSPAYLIQDGPLAYHHSMSEIAQLEDVLCTTIHNLTEISERQDAWETILPTQHLSFPLGSTPMAALFGKPDIIPEAPAYQTTLTPKNIIRGYMGDFVSETLARYPLVSPEKVIGLSEMYSGILAGVYESYDFETYSEALRTNPADMILFLLVVAIGSLVEAQRGPARDGTIATINEGALAPTDLGWATVPGFGFLMEAINAMESKSLKLYKSMKTWQVRAWLLVAIYYSSMGMMSATRKVIKKAASRMMKVITKTTSSDFKDGGVDGEIIMLYWSFLHFQIDIQYSLDPHSSSCLSSVTSRFQAPSLRYASARGYIPAYGFSPYTLIMFRDQIHSTVSYVASLARPTTLSNLQEREDAFLIPVETLPDGSMPTAPVSRAENIAWATALYRRALLKVITYSPFVSTGLSGSLAEYQNQDVIEECVLRGVTAIHECLVAEQDAQGAWCVFGHAIKNLLIMTKVCENLDLRCPVHVDTVQIIADRLAIYLANVSPSALAMRLTGHPQLRQY